jgi:nitric oxide reductase NorQ protein
MVVDMPPLSAIRMGIVNKSFDVFEKEMLEDVIATQIPSSWTRAEIFEG